jgi:hypothetical protein
MPNLGPHTNEQIQPMCFVASPSEPLELLRGLSEAIATANRQGELQFQLWTKNDIAGRSLVTPIHENISNSVIFAADVTYLNLNVTYEVGYAIGQSKRVLLTRYRGLKGDIELSKDIGIFDTLGRHEYDRFEQLAQFLESKHDLAPISTAYPLDAVKRLFFLDIPGSSDVVRQIVSAIKREFRLYRSFSDEESIRLSASGAIESVASSSGIVIPFLDEQFTGSAVHNFRAMFVAGLAHGLERPVLILKSSRVVAPIDIRDSTSDFDGPQDIDRLIAKFRPEVDVAFERLNARTPGALGLLQELSIGDGAAENEFTTLKAYFIPTDAFGRTLQGNVDLVTGRKGSGKTALFFQIRDRLRGNKDNVVVDLKPEGYQLTQLKESVLQYLKAGSQSYLITAFWHYLILMEIVHRIIETDSQRHKFDHRLVGPYEELLAIYQKADVEFEGDFSQRLLILTRAVAERYQRLKADLSSLTSSDVTQIVYLHDIKALEASLAKYLRFKDDVWILFDNLDKGWTAGGVTPEDIVILRCLIDAAKKVRNELSQKKINFRSVLFIRNDVFELLMEGTADYGKDSRVNLDWTDRRQLVELLIRRLQFGHKGFSDMSPKDIWATIFADGRSPDAGMSLFLDHSLLRPRNLIQLFQHCKGFAVNVGHERIMDDDITSALEAYSTDIVTEINREIGDVFSQAPRILYDFAHEPCTVSHEDLIVLGELKGLDRAASERLIDLLFYYAFIGLPEVGGRCTYIYDTHYDMELLKALSRKRGRAPVYRIHPAFWPALRIQSPAASKPDQPTML